MVTYVQAAESSTILNFPDENASLPAEVYSYKSGELAVPAAYKVYLKAVSLTGEGPPSNVLTRKVVDPSGKSVCLTQYCTLAYTRAYPVNANMMLLIRCSRL